MQGEGEVKNEEDYPMNRDPINHPDAYTPIKIPDWSGLVRDRDELRTRIAQFADVWTNLTPDQRTAIRRHSEDLYDAMGRSATEHYNWAHQSQSPG
jgi:hypothetical protein